MAEAREPQPADPDGWLRLARAYGVLGEADKARDALAAAEAEIAKLPEDSPERAALAQRLAAQRQAQPSP